MPDVQDCDECGRTTRGELCRDCKDTETSLEESIAKAIKFKEEQDG